MNEKVFQVNLQDNVAVALTALEAGSTVPLIGDTEQKEITAVTDIPVGHKIALRDISDGEDIVKYGVVIGHAIKNIPKGSWVHLEEMASNYDERSSHLDAVTGAPKDMSYK
ncbi:MAG: UxaA family hydrolase [Oribacterium sp.]|nr:UxaA family hydrolase [Oribacterium sp.]MBO6308524.1 UxaA family hydrolase [Oribacterium sp.]MCR5008465.1 UxaA family hydrolase [Oribacterium sp.]